MQEVYMGWWSQMKFPFNSTISWQFVVGSWQKLVGPRPFLPTANRQLRTCWNFVTSEVLALRVPNSDNS